MQLRRFPSDRVILILGAPRSGTSWLAKIFDSHPDVLYRHEPDTVLRTEAFPWMCASDDIAPYREAGEAYLRQLMEVATLKSAGSIPMFRKRHRSLFASHLRSATVYGLRAAEMAGTGRRLVPEHPGFPTNSIWRAIRRYGWSSSRSVREGVPACLLRRYPALGSSSFCVTRLARWLPCCAAPH